MSLIDMHKSNDLFQNGKWNSILLAFFIVILINLQACGQAAKNSTENNTRQTGLFIDSPVAGLFYRTPSHQGLSNSA
ncbi:MAG: hypothetical protein OEY38_23900, partial [Gammaproteobacteria bacterium]|nr:hypothetical protein [Gammaproteobacteria bacterium]